MYRVKDRPEYLTEGTFSTLIVFMSIHYVIHQGTVCPPTVLLHDATVKAAFRPTITLRWSHNLFIKCTATYAPGLMRETISQTRKIDNFSLIFKTL